MQCPLIVGSGYKKIHPYFIPTHRNCNGLNRLTEVKISLTIGPIVVSTPAPTLARAAVPNRSGIGDIGTERDCDLVIFLLCERMP